MISVMNSPALIQGSAEPVTPTRIAAASAHPAHAFLNVIRDLIHKAGYHNEGEVLNALKAVADYERQVVSAGDLRQVTGENDRAPFEDVSQRKPPNQVTPNQPVMVGGNIDYLALARALAQVQAERNEEQQGPVVPAQ